MNKPFFTIILIDSGDASLLQKSLLLLKEQLNASWELIVSTEVDFDYSMLDTIGFDNDTQQRIRVITHDLSKNPIKLNACVSTARGEYIVFLKSCDFWSGIHLESIYQHAILYAECDFFVLSAILYTQSTVKDMFYINVVVHHPARCSSYYSAHDIVAGCFPKLSQVAVRRRVLLEKQGFDENFSEFFLEKFCMDIFSPTAMRVINAFSVYIYEGADTTFSAKIQIEKDIIDACIAHNFAEFAVAADISRKFDALKKSMGSNSANCAITTENSSTTVHATLPCPPKNCLHLFFRAKHSIYFNAHWYKEHYGIQCVFPFLHYCILGWKKGYDPSTMFSTQHYLNTNPDVQSAKVNPLLHYVQSGVYEGRSI